MKTVWTRTAIPLAIAVTLGCQPPRTPLPKTAIAPADDPRAQIRDDLRKSDDAAVNRRLLEEWNAARAGDRPTATEPGPWAAELGLTADEIARIGRPEFTPLDAYHVAESMLMKAIVRGLDVEALPPAERLDAALDWTVRHVRLVPRDGPPDTPELIVDRGTGNPTERLLVFAALVRQLDLIPALVGDATGNPANCWAVAVLIDESLQLYDPRLGVRLPGSLTEIRADPSRLAPLTVDSRYPYDVTPDRARTASLYPAMTLSALSARSAELQSFLGADVGNLAVDWPVESAALARAAFGGPIRRWSPDKPGSPLRALAESLPPDEGGTDTAPTGQRRRDKFLSERVPWAALPQEILELPPPLGPQLRSGFIGMTTIQHRPGMPKQVRQRQQYLDSVREGSRELSRDVRQQIVANMMSEFDRGQGQATGPSLARLVATGRGDEATEVLVKMADDLRKLREQIERIAPPWETVRQWTEAVRSATAELLRAQRGRDAAALESAFDRLEALRVSPEARAIGTFVQLRAADPTLTEVLYLTALAKHDQARLRQRRSAGEATAAAWRTAATSWTRLLGQPASPALIAHAKLQLARAKSAAGAPSRDAYRAAADGNLMPIEKTAALLAAANSAE